MTQQLQRQPPNVSLAIRTGEQLGFTRDQIEVIKDNVARGASDAQLAMFLHVAKRAGLDPIARQICMIERGGKWTIQTTIDGYRLIADRTGKYVPGRQPSFAYKNDKLYSATAYIKKLVAGTWHEIDATAFWSEYVQEFRGQVGHMWQKMPHVMLSKCAEALALRRAFPAEMSGIYTADEMSQADMHEIETHTLTDEQAEAALAEAARVEREHVIGVEATVVDAPGSPKPVASIKEKRAQGLVAMNLVTRFDGGFQVQHPTVKGKPELHYTVKRDQQQHVVCNCEEFQDEVIKDEKYRCEHILAVKFFLEAKPKIEQATDGQPSGEGHSQTSSSSDPKSETFNRKALLSAIEDARLKLETINTTDWSVEAFALYLHDEYGVEKGINDPALSLDDLKAIKASLWARVDEHMKKHGQAQANKAQEFPRDPLAKSMADLVTPKQLSMIKALAREASVDADDECQRVLKCKADELSKKAASSFIDHLKSLNQQA